MGLILKLIQLNIILFISGTTTLVASTTFANSTAFQYSDYHGTYTQTWNGEPATKEEVGFLRMVKAEAITNAQEETNDTLGLVACIRRNICGEFSMSRYALIKSYQIANRKYRDLLALSNIRKLITGQGKLIFQSGLPGITISPEERAEIFRIYQGDRKAIQESIEYKNSFAAYLAPEGAFRPSNEKLFNQGLEESLSLYQIQLETTVAESPFLVYLDSEYPTAEDLVQAMEKLVPEQQYAKMEVENTNNLTEFAYFQRSFKSVVEKTQKFEIARSILSKAMKPYTLLNWFKSKSSLVALGMTGCFLLASLTQTWPVTMACATVGMALGMRSLLYAWLRDSMEVRLWLTKLRTLEQLQKVRADFTFQVVMTVLVAQGYGTLLQQGLRTTAKRILARMRYSVRLVGRNQLEIVRRVRDFGWGMIKFDGITELRATTLGGNTKLVYGTMVQIAGHPRPTVLASSHPYMTLADYIFLNTREVVVDASPVFDTDTTTGSNAG